MSSGDNEKINETFQFCERIVGSAQEDSSNIQDDLKKCVDKLQQLLKEVEQLALFSTNDQIEELPTSSLQYLLAPAYLAFAIENINTGLEKRVMYLQAAQLHYRAFLERLLVYDVIAFKLPWIISDKDDSTITIKEDEGDRRMRKIERHMQEKVLAENLEKLKLAKKREEDESTMREIYIVQMRLWAIKAIKALEMIDDELEMLAHREKVLGGEAPLPQTSSSDSKPLKTFTIVRSEEQKKVFGLGYPSIPTVTVNEWFDEMSKTGHFSGLNKPLTIKGTEDEEDKPDSDEDDSEEARQKKIKWDEFKDDNPRGAGNTYNKG